MYSFVFIYFLKDFRILYTYIELGTTVFVEYSDHLYFLGFNFTYRAVTNAFTSQKL